MKLRIFITSLIIVVALMVNISCNKYINQFQKESFQTNHGSFDIILIGHASLILSYQGKLIYIDPFGKLADYSKLPKADLILITHEHRDHFDLKAINAIRKQHTQVILTKICSQKIKGQIMSNGDILKKLNITIKAVPAYNLVHKRPNGHFYHPKGRGNGYILTIDNKRLYIAGDTENIPEMKDLKNIDIAFLPMNIPYTMTPEMTADAAKMIRPKILYPYHYRGTDPNKLSKLLKKEKDIEVRIRKM